jgi:uncharacterized protein (DUF58 family)
LKFSERGSVISVAAAVQALIALVLRDIVLVAVSLALFLIIAAEILLLFIRKGRVLSILRRNMEKLSLSMPAGSRKEVFIRTGSLPRYLLPVEAEWANIKIERGGVLLILSPKLFGRHLFTPEFIIFSPLGLLFSRIRWNKEVEVLCMPRSLGSILRAVSIIAGEGGEIGESGRGAGEGFGRLVRPEGLEYVGTREYIPGERVRRVDWPATSRMLKIMIRKYAASGGEILLLVNLDNPGPKTADFTASAMLSTAIACFKSGFSANLMFISRGKLISAGKLEGDEMLRLSVATSLKLLNMSYESLEFISPRSSSNIALILKEIGAVKLEEYFRERIRDIRSFLAGLPELIVYSGSLVSNHLLLIDLMSELSRKGLRTLIVVHPKPWVDAASPAEERVLKITHYHMLEAMKRYFKVSFNPEAPEREVMLVRIQR